jgi:hypothetical protein
MAGLWEQYWAPETARDGPPDITSFTIVVTIANTLIQPLHERMPVILGREDRARWLGPGPITPEDPPHLLAPTSPHGWVVEPVSTGVNSPRMTARISSSHCRATTELLPPGNRAAMASPPDRGAQAGRLTTNLTLRIIPRSLGPGSERQSISPQACRAGQSLQGRSQFLRP